jgi:phosphoglycolate phosphatase
MQEILGHLEGKRHVIWDWNGTLLDDVDLAVDAIGDVLESNGLERIAREKYLEQFCFPISEYYRRLGFDLEPSAFDRVTRQFVEAYRKRVAHSRLHRGCEDVLKAVKAIPAKQSILSAAHQNDLHELLTHFKIAPYFDHVFGLSDHYAASKVERGRELLLACGVVAAESVLIGDTDHDREVGRELGVDVILLSGGHQPETRLREILAGAKYLHRR